MVVALGCLVACSGDGLVENEDTLDTAPDGMGFVALHLENTAGNNFTNSENFDITLSHLSIVSAGLELERVGAATVVKAHGTDDHDTPTDTDHDALENCVEAEHLQQAHYITLDEVYVFECVALDVGSYSSLALHWANPAETENIIDLDEAIEEALLVEGSASLGGTVYNFVIAGTPETMMINTSYSILQEDNHFFIHMDAAEWFHGIDFSTLEMSGDGTIYIDAENNEHTYEHVLEHMAESLTLES